MTLILLGQKPVQCGKKHTWTFCIWTSTKGKLRRPRQTAAQYL